MFEKLSPLELVFYLCRYTPLLFSAYTLAKKIAVRNRVARWFVFKPKIPIWENFGGP
jgi:hypothetical protein